MKPESGKINGKKGGLKSAPARFCRVIKILRTVPSISKKPERMFWRRKINKGQGTV